MRRELEPDRRAGCDPRALNRLKAGLRTSRVSRLLRRVPAALWQRGERARCRCLRAMESKNRWLRPASSEPWVTRHRLWLARQAFHLTALNRPRRAASTATRPRLDAPAW